MKGKEITMPEGYFSGRKAKAPTEIEVELAEQGLRETAARMDTICVKRRYGGLLR